MFLNLDKLSEILTQLTLMNTKLAAISAQLPTELSVDGRLKTATL